MLRIGKLTDYALLIIGKMAKEPHLVMSATALADTLHLSPPTVSKILKMLSERGLVASVRGAEGGYHLAIPANQISLASIITSMEGEFAMTQCCEKLEQCTIQSLCTMRENWQKINGFVKSFLTNLTITDMLEPLSLKAKGFSNE